MGMWESRGLCEISKRLWKSICDFHSRVISTAGCALRDHLLWLRIRGEQALRAETIVDPGAAGAVEVAGDRGHAPVPRRFRIR